MKKLVVLGGGISGYGSAILARRKGFDVFLSDSGRIADRYRMKLEAWGVPYEEGGHSEERILAASECVKSPGIPETAPLVEPVEPVLPTAPDRIRGALSRRCAHDLHHRFERQDDHHVARLPDSARRGLQRRPGRQHRRELRLFGRHGVVRLVCAGAEFVPAGRHV